MDGSPAMVSDDDMSWRAREYYSDNRFSWRIVNAVWDVFTLKSTKAFQNILYNNQINPSLWYQTNIDNFPTTFVVFITIQQLRMFPHKVSAWYAIATILTHKHRIWLNNRKPGEILEKPRRQEQYTHSQ